MVIVALGFYNELDKIEFNNILKKFFPVNLEYDYKPYNIESEIVLDLVKEEYKLFDIGVLNTDNETPPFFSGPLIWEIEEYSNSLYDKENEPNPEPIFFKIIDSIITSKISKFILIFADEVSEKIGIRIEKININKLKDRICEFEVWEEVYYSLLDKHNYVEIYHPLVLLVSKE